MSEATQLASSGARLPAQGGLPPEPSLFAPGQGEAGRPVVRVELAPARPRLLIPGGGGGGGAHPETALCLPLSPQLRLFGRVTDESAA